MANPPGDGQNENEPAPQLGLFGEVVPTRQDRPFAAAFDERRRLRAEQRRAALDPNPAAGEGSDSAAPGVEESLSDPTAAADQTPIVRADSPATPRRKRTRAGSGSSLPAWAYSAMKPPASPPATNRLPLNVTVPRPQDERFEELADHPSEDQDFTHKVAADTRRIWTVGDLVGSVRAHIEQAWADLWVHGEISNLRTAPSGHLYFTLKDGESQLPAVLFRRQAQLLRFRPEDGLEVLLRGKLSVYEQRGQTQLIGEHLEPVGAGSLQIAFEQLKARLADEGLFDASRKRELPPYPRCVGIVTSPAGAVIRDFLNVAGRRHAALDILLYPAAVQGASAAAEVAAGIAYFNKARNVDVIVIARGGGSLEDMAPFNTEVIARAIAASALPVVSAVGHETDFTIADFVADLRAPTPSAAAELITAAQHRVEEQVAALAERLGRACRYQLILARQRLGALPLQPARLTESFNRREQRVDTVRFRMEAALRQQLHTASSRVTQCSVDAAYARLRTGLAQRSRAFESLQHRLQRGHAAHLSLHRERLQSATSALLRQDAVHRVALLRNRWNALDARLVRIAAAHGRGPLQRLQLLASQLESLSPLAVLSRGYALVFDERGALVKRAADVHAGELLTLRLTEGRVRSRVEDAATGSGEA